MSETFKKAAAEAKTLAQSPTNEEMLKLYANYKQVTVGNCNTTRPGILDLTGKAKWDAWNGLKDKPKDQAEADYIALVEELKGKYGVN